MSIFIKANIDEELCRKGQPCAACVSVCPVSVFGAQAQHVAVLSENEDECILCDLCLDRCPTQAITINRLYAQTRKAAPVTTS
jgi:NAD-dependent dihydropyrimidine dehydrogenase PreA subunit